MDNLTHSLAGSALAAAGLRKATPLATATLVVAANGPDVDAFIYLFRDEYYALSFRRGWTHGPLAMLILPFLVAAGMLAWDRWVRRRRDPTAAPARPGPLLALAWIGVLSHPALDWMNTYGIRFLMPFTERWFYGDALFIIDPWLWLALAAATLSAFRPRGRSLMAWLGLATLASALVLAVPLVPPVAKAGWLIGIMAVAALSHWSGATRAPEARGTRAAQGALGVGVAYILLMIGSDLAASRRVLAEATALGLGPVEAIMVAPIPANPLGGEVVIRTPTAYHLGHFRWLGEPRVTIGTDSLRIVEPDEVIAAASALDDVRHFLAWSRFPTFQVDTLPDGYRVRIGDARYPGDWGEGGGLGGLVVRLDRSLRPVAP